MCAYIHGYTIKRSMCLSFKCWIYTTMKLVFAFQVLSIPLGNLQLQFKCTRIPFWKIITRCLCLHFKCIYILYILHVLIHTCIYNEEACICIVCAEYITQWNLCLHCKWWFIPSRNLCLRFRGMDGVESLVSVLRDESVNTDTVKLDVENLEISNKYKTKQYKK